MALNEEALWRQVPYYLTADPARKELFASLQALNDGANKGYFIPSAFDSFSTKMLQGDGWAGLHLYSFNRQSVIGVRGVVISNSCDVAPENDRAIPPRLTFAPLVKLSAVETRFRSFGLSDAQVDAKVTAIRAQSVTSIFFLPAEAPLEEEYVVLLDDIHSLPAALMKETGKKIYTLSMAAFYMFTFKLSIHFCRLQENVDRG